MKVFLYHSTLCPRCQLAKHHLRKLITLYPQLELDEVNVLQNLKLIKYKGLKMIPALECGDLKLSGIYLTKKRLKEFLQDASLACESAP